MTKGQHGMRLASEEPPRKGMRTGYLSRMPKGGLLMMEIGPETSGHAAAAHHFNNRLVAIRCGYPLCSCPDGGPCEAKR